MKLRFLKVFVILFVLTFAVLNGRFLLANISYWLKINAELPDLTQLLPAKNKSPVPLPNMATLTVGKIGITAPIVFNVGSDNDKIFKNLENGVVHYSDTPKPGLDGISVILGHSSAYPWYRGSYGSVFALLGKLEPGDKFSVQYSDGRVFSFAVKQSLIFSPFSDDSQLKQIEKYPGSSLVLISCWPIGTNYKRIAVQAELVK